MASVPVPVNYLTIDVEDYFQVAAFDQVIQPDNWESYECRVEQNTQCILKILAEKGISATFFIVGWIAERYPGLVRDIQQQGHQIGCHSYWHKKIYTLTPEQFKADTQKAKQILEDIIGEPVSGYRAPSYSITGKSLWALDILQELGFQYDSSIFPIYHDNYGIPDAPRFSYRLDQGMMEFPISTVSLLGKNLPIAGGGYFRLFPYTFTRACLRRINQWEREPFVFYVHPWEFDPEQPRIADAGWKSRFRHYNNLDKTETRFRQLLDDFSFGPLYTAS